MTNELKNLRIVTERIKEYTDGKIQETSDAIMREVEKNTDSIENTQEAIEYHLTEIYNTASEHSESILDHSERISNLENGVPTFLFSTDNSTARVKTVPANALPYAEVSKVGGVARKCANLIPYPYSKSTTTTNGITFTDNGDGSITINGTSTVTSTIYYVPVTVTGLEDGKTYTYTDCNGGDSLGNSRIYCKENSTGYTNGKSFTVISGRTYNLEVVVSVGETYNNYVVYPMLNEGSTALPYDQYFKGLRHVAITEVVSADIDGETILSSLPIPEAVQALEGYGLGVNNTEYNYVDWERKVYVQNVIAYTFTGAEAIGVMNASGSPEWNYVLPTAKSGNNSGTAVNCVCNRYTATYRNSVSSNVTSGRLSVQDKYIRWRDSNATTVEEMQAILKEWYDAGNPLEVAYVLATPIETDISDILPDDNFLKVIGGGTITAVNEHNYDVPTEITYMVMEERI